MTRTAQQPEENGTDWKYSILIIDMYHSYDPDEDYVAAFFPTFALAREYARRFVRSQIEEMRKKESDPVKLRRGWYGFGEDALVLGGSENERYAAAGEIGYFISHPATADEVDFQSILAYGRANRPGAA
jgi:hypothetical protein